jgi:hypothetical protein
LAKRRGRFGGRHLTIIQAGCNSGQATKPITAVAAIRSALWTFQRNKIAREATPIRALGLLPTAMRPSRMQAPRMVPIAAA